MIALLLIGMLAGDGSERPAETPRVDAVVVVKSERTLTLLAHGKVIRTYKVKLGGTPVGAKERQGDHKTPEGHYLLDRRNPKSQFYKSIHVSYPSAGDVRRAQQKGYPPGGDIMIHGLPNDRADREAALRTPDWTDGCVAVTDTEMDEIWKLVADGTPIEIKP